MGSPTQPDDVIVSLPRNITIRKYRTDGVDGKNLAKTGDNEKIWFNVRNTRPNPYTVEASEFWCKHVYSPEMLASSGPMDEETHKTRAGGFEGRTAGTGPKIPSHYVIAIDDQAVGSIAVMFKTDVSFRTGEIGFWLGEEHWGKGVMSLVLPAFVRWAFDTFGVLLRLMGEAYDWNLASAKLFEKAGFKREGVQVDAIVKDGRIGSIKLYGLTRREIEKGTEN